MEALARPITPTFGSASKSNISRSASAEPGLVFDDLQDDLQVKHQSQYTEPSTVSASALDEPGSYDLKPPPPSASHNNLETLARRFYSVDHLNTILKDQALSARFHAFLQQYRPQHVPYLTQYIDARKSQTAVEYANVVANQLPAQSVHAPYIAATLNGRFQSRIHETLEPLLEDALPAYITHRLTLLVTESLVKEITGNNAPIMRELIPSLAEVYCITDPALPDNPIVYASEEFYNVSQYGREYVIGRNCRFLQGPETSNFTVRRLKDALSAGQPITETLLNYRRDGSPFMNLLMMAPLHDNQGRVRYFLGCQIDVTSLIEEGRGLESFARLLARDRSKERYGDSLDQDPTYVLSEFGAMLNEEEKDIIIKNRPRRASEDGHRNGTRSGTRSGTNMSDSVHAPRRRLNMDNVPSADRSLWPHPSLGQSGRLPGVYQNYLLVRPYPSLRITFTSPALRIPGLLQTNFLDRIGGPESVRDGVLDSFAHGTGVTAKIAWLSKNHGGSDEGKPRWIHCTPLLGSDEKVGVWMVVIADNEEITGQLHRGNASQEPVSKSGSAPMAPLPALPRRGAASPRFTGNKLYAEYLRREGRSGTLDSETESVEADHRFKEF